MKYNKGDVIEIVSAGHDDWTGLKFKVINDLEDSLYLEHGDNRPDKLLIDFYFPKNRVKLAIDKRFNAGDIVRIVGQSSAVGNWIGLEFEVLDEVIGNATQLKDNGKRPDGFKSDFYWRTADLELVVKEPNYLCMLTDLSIAANNGGHGEVEFMLSTWLEVVKQYNATVDNRR